MALSFGQNYINELCLARIRCRRLCMRIMRGWLKSELGVGVGVGVGVRVGVGGLVRGEDKRRGMGVR